MVWSSDALNLYSSFTSVSSFIVTIFHFQQKQKSFSQGQTVENIERQFMIFLMFIPQNGAKFCLANRTTDITTHVEVVNIYSQKSNLLKYLDIKSYLV